MCWKEVKKESDTPTAGVEVLVCEKISHDKVKKYIAFYVPKLFLKEDSFNNKLENCYSEYDPKTNANYFPEGWYYKNKITSQNWKIEQKITHWMELP